MTSDLSWLSQLKRTYIGNATATRDMRVQLRGSRAAVLFTIYLAMMAFVLLLVYSSSLGREGQYSLASAQSTLQSFYYQTLTALGIVVTLAAPSMGAFAIVSEKQRRSLDLVFSAPTEPKYYLVGKLISSFRYVWLLLVLSLPFCAISVTLGGATWGQLFLTFFLFSLYGLVCVSIGLLMSTLCSKILPAIIWTYLAVILYWIIGMGSLSLSGLTTNPFAQVNPFSSLLPMTFPFVADQVWPVFGREVPTWILSALLHLAIVRLLILAAGSLLAPGSSREIKVLRIHGLVYSAAFLFLIGYNCDPAVVSLISRDVFTGSTTGPAELIQTSANYHVVHGRILFGLLFVIGVMIVPYLASFGFQDLRRHRPNGVFRLKDILNGRPAGHLPYLLLLMGVSVTAYVIGTLIMHGSLPASPTKVVFTPFALSFWMYILDIVNLWFIAFMIGFLVCGSKPNLSRGRTFSLFFFILAIILPTALFAVIAPDDLHQGTGIWLLNPTAGVISDFPAAMITLYQSFALTCVSIILALLTIPKVLKQSAIDVEKRLELANDRA